MELLGSNDRGTSIEYVRERGERRIKGLEHARRECKDRNKWRLLCHGHPLTGGVLRNRCQIQIGKYTPVRTFTLAFRDMEQVGVAKRKSCQIVITPEPYDDSLWNTFLALHQQQLKVAARRLPGMGMAREW